MKTDGWQGRRAIRYQGQLAGIGVNGLDELFSSGTGTLTHVSNLGDEYTPAEARLRRIFDRLSSRIEGIIMTSAENQAEDIGNQLAKAKGEIDGLVGSLQGSSVSQETLDQLKATSQALDDIVPDEVVPEPEPEPEPAPEEPTA